MWNFQEDLKKWKEYEEKAMNLLNDNWFNLISNPEKKGMDLLMLENGIEIKVDEKSKFTWNFYIEFECNWKPSGIFREETINLKWWWHSDWERLFLLSGDQLKKWVTEKIDNCRANKSLTSKWTRVVEFWWNWGRTKGLLIPIQQFEELSEKIYTF